jgi:hypothetical protein
MRQENNTAIKESLIMQTPEKIKISIKEGTDLNNLEAYLQIPDS